MDIASLGFRIDSSQAVKAAKDLDRLTEAAGRAERATGKVRGAGGGGAAGPGPEGGMRREAENGRDSGGVDGAMGREAARKPGAKDAIKMAQEVTGLVKALKESKDPMMTFIEHGLKIAEVAVSAGGNISQWAQAFGLTNPYVLAAAVAVAALAGAFVLFHREATKDYSDLPKKLGLTAKEMENLKAKGIDTSVTMGDTFKALFQVLGEDTKTWSDGMLTSMGTSWTEIGKIASQVLDDLTKGLAFVFALFRAGWESQIQGFSFLFRNIGPIVGDTFIGVFNFLSKLVAGFFNREIDKINGYIDQLNTIFGKRLDHLGHLEPVEIANQYKGAAEKAVKAWTTPFGKVKQYMDEALGYPAKAGIAAAANRINQIQANRYGDPKGAGDAGCSCPTGAAQDASNDNSVSTTNNVIMQTGNTAQAVAEQGENALKGIADAATETSEALHPLRDKIAEIGEDLSKSLGQAIINGEDLGDVMTSTFKRIAAEWASQGIQKMFDGLIGKKGGADTGILGGLFGGASGGGGSGGFLSTMVKSIGSFFSFDGGGYTGEGSRSGGMDGKGGFLAVMHPRETVVDHTRGSGGGGGQAVQVAVSVTVDDDGKIRAYVRDSSARAVQTGISQYDAGMPQRVAAIGNDPRRR